MAKGSVRKKGKKWYYRFYIEDESGNRVQKEYPGTESKSETEALLRKAMEDYENTKFVAMAKNITVGDMLDMWIAEEVVPSGKSNGTVTSYSNIIKYIKQHPIGKRKLQTVKVEHLQKFFDKICAEGNRGKPFSYMTAYGYAAVMRGAFRFAVFPKQFITFNPMQYVVVRAKKNDCEMFDTDVDTDSSIISNEQFKAITDYLTKKKHPAILPIQIAYYTGLRLGEVCALTWQDVNLDEQYLTVRRSMSYNHTEKKVEIGPTKRNKVRTVDFGESLTTILREAKAKQEQNCKTYGEYYRQNYYLQRRVGNRTHYELCSLGVSEQPADGFVPIDFVCTNADGKYIRRETLGQLCLRLQKEIEGLKGFHFHSLRHTYTSNLLALGAAPKDVQELLGHDDVKLTMNVYAHATREAKRNSARLLDELDKAQ